MLTRLNARHAILYPISTRLGIPGANKAEKRHNVQQLIRTRLRHYSPFPPLATHLPATHQGHALTGPIQNTGVKNLAAAGGWSQLVRVFFFSL